MVDVTLPALVELSQPTKVYRAKLSAASTLWPAFDITIDNPANAATSALYRPIDLKMPFSANDDERWTYDTSQQMTVTHGSQVGTAVLGERYGSEYAYLHVRGISVPPGGHLTGCTVERASAPSTPRYASASEGLSQFTGANSITLHVGLMTGGDSAVPIPDVAWVQKESGPGRHKWEAWVFDTASGIHWAVRVYTWPGLSRVEGTVAAIYHDERDRNAYSTSFQYLRLSFPNAYFDLRAMWQAARGMTIGIPPSDPTRRYVQLCGAKFLGDGQSVRARFVAMPWAAPQAEKDDWGWSIVWPVKAVCDPDFWEGRIGPHRYIPGHRGFWDVGPQWGDGGETFRNHCWNVPDIRGGFVAWRNLLEAEGASFERWPRDRRTGGIDTNTGGARPSYGNSTLPLILGVRYGNPRSLMDLELDSLWESCMRPTSFPKWTSGTPQDRLVSLGDIPLGLTPGGLYLTSQRLNYQAMKNDPNFFSFGKEYFDPARYFFPGLDCLGGAGGFKSTHHEVTQVAALALLNDIDDHETDFMQMQAALYPFNDKNYDEEDGTGSSTSEYRSGRAEMAACWAFETLDSAQREWILDFWELRFAPTTVSGKTYFELWDHLAKKHGWQTWGQMFHDSDRIRSLLNIYSASWDRSRGIPGYALSAQMLRHFRSNGDGVVRVAHEARHWLRYDWRRINDRWKPVYGMTYIGRILPDQKDSESWRTGGYIDASLYGNAPPDDVAYYADTTRVIMDDVNSIWWHLGAVQEARRLVLEEFGDAELAARADEIIEEIAEAFPRINDIDSQKIKAWMLEPEQHASDTIPLPDSVVVRMPTLIEKDPQTAFSLVRGGFGIVMPALVEQEPTQGGYTVLVLPAPPSEYVLTMAGSTEREPTMTGQGVLGGAIIGWGRLVTEVEPTQGGRGTLPKIVTMPALVELSLPTAFAVAGGGGSPSLHQHRGKWQGTQSVRGRWGEAMTDQGITITAGDSERIRVDVYDGTTLLDLSIASSAEFRLARPATPYTAEVELLRRSMLDGISVSSGAAIVDLGDTSALTPGLATWSLRVTYGGQAQTVVRAPARILANPSPPPSSGGDADIFPIT